MVYCIAIPVLLIGLSAIAAIVQGSKSDRVESYPVYQLEFSKSEPVGERFRGYCK